MKPTLSEAIDTVLSEVLEPFGESDLAEVYTASDNWDSPHTYDDCVAVLSQKGWFTLKERKPENGEYCLLTIQEKFYTLVPAQVFQWGRGGFWPVVDIGTEYDSPVEHTVLAWMPLPQPYTHKGVENERD